ncbi:RING/U-box domain-containing protein [Planoprotostelium fungivorum]|uniref:RING-type E3 ubiquitin transferase n=1 Tax=Planoprotostelium fungivorum TaxID=1890364 RepID=A0A2P6NHY6_9EUKA|nr:RING/U-box domain-containing protein [Planoprotostelium fungivorum]
MTETIHFESWEECLSDEALDEPIVQCVVVEHVIDDNVCSICLDELAEHRAQIGLCKHNFCYPCIIRWSTFKKQCPLCNCKYESITATNGSDPSKEEILPAPTEPLPGQRGEMFDNNWFIRKFGDMLKEGERIRRTIAITGGNYSGLKGRKVYDSWDEEKLEMLEKMIPILRGLINFFQLEDHYDAQMFLNQMYEIEDEMKILHAPRGRSSQDVPVRRYGANDLDQLEEDEYYDDEEEDVYHKQEQFRKSSRGSAGKNKSGRRH